MRGQFLFALAVGSVHHLFSVSPSSDPTEWEDAKFDWSSKGIYCTRIVVVNTWLENEENFKDEH